MMRLRLSVCKCRCYAIASDQKWTYFCTVHAM